MRKAQKMTFNLNPILLQLRCVKNSLKKDVKFMAGALNKFLEKVNFTETEPFKDTEVSKVVVHKLDSTWTVHISNKTPLAVETISKLKAVCKDGFGEVKRVDIEVANDSFDDSDILSYLKYYMEELSTKSPALKSLHGNEVTVKNKAVTVEVTNFVEKNLISTKKDKIVAWLDRMGLPGVTIETVANDTKRNRIKEAIKKSKETAADVVKVPTVAYEEKKSNPVLEIKGSALFGVPFDDSRVVAIKDIKEEKRGVCIVAYIDEMRVVESQRTDYKIFTITVNDGETAFTCKLFTNDNNVYQFLLKNLKEGNWYKWRGSVKNDDYMHKQVLTIRNIMECDEKSMKNPATTSSASDAPKPTSMPADAFADFGEVPEYIPEDDDYANLGDDAFFAFDDDVPMPEYTFDGVEEPLPDAFSETATPTVPETKAAEASTIESVNEPNVPNPKDAPYIPEEATPIVRENNPYKNNYSTTAPHRETDDEGNKIIVGDAVKSLVKEMKNVFEPINLCAFEAKIFDTDFFESSKTQFKIITLKITDKTDSFLAKIFTRDAEEFKRLSKELKKDKWIKVEGNIKYDDYAKDLVLSVQNLVEIPNKDTHLTDDAPVKRIELHTHTTMSQMDGLVDAGKYIDTLHKMGYKAVAITDHNGVQSFPDAFHKVNDINKGIEKPEDRFKVLYGAEFTMIEDSVDVVKRPLDMPSLDATYCVFDFETTGFNAGGGDTIIEIGAVLIKGGVIIDRFDELIDPGRPLPAKITEITNITDAMLAGKDTEENAVKRFIEFFKDYPMVAHNAKFDVSFLEMAYKKYDLGEFTNCIIDTLELSRTLDNGFARHSLSALVKRYNVEWDENAHHRADYDAEGTAYVLDKMIKKMYNQNIENIKDFNNLVQKDEIYKYGKSYHINVLVKNKVGLKNLFQLVSLANTKYLHNTPRILRSEIIAHRDGLLIGSGCYQSEIFTQARRLGEEELSNLIQFYDYVEVQPPEVYSHLVDMGEFYNTVELQNHITKIIDATKESGKLIVATGDVHHFLKEDKISREIIVNQKVPGGGRHPLAKSEIKNIPSQHFRTTAEMLSDFAFLDPKVAEEIVVANTNKIADLCEEVEVIIDTHGVPFAPKIENSDTIVKEMVYKRAHELYGDPLPSLIANRIEDELRGIIKGGYDVIYLIAQKLVAHSNEEGYLVGSRGSVGSSFVATMMGITEVNPLPAHYVCPQCKKTIFEENGKNLSDDYSCGYDLPDKDCPDCHIPMDKQGHDMPFATFLGFDADKVPDIDLNFSGDNQASAHEYTKVLFGVDNVYRAGTIGTVADKTAYGFVKGYCEAKNITNMKSVEVERLAQGCVGVKRTTGQHPGGIVVIPDYMDVHDFTPFQYPADDLNSAWRTTHFDYHAIDQDVLKLDILGHDDPTVLRMLQDLSGIDVTSVPLGEKDTMSLFLSPEILGVTPEDIECNTGTLAIPEFGTKFVLKMLEDTKPKTFAELIKISGLSHGTDVWAGNARELIQSGQAEFKDIVGCRDDIMVNLIAYGMESKKAFKIMEFVRKGKPTKDPETWAGFAEDMRACNVPEWYIENCRRIKYMFPKAHAAAYVISAFRIAWFKVHKPLYYYASYYSVRCMDFDITVMCAGYDAIKRRFDEINDKGFDATDKESALADELQLAMEMYKRGISFKMIDLEKSDARNFVIGDDGKSLIFPFRGLDGLGENVAKAIVAERAKGAFLSIEDLAMRAKVNSTTIERMRALHIFDGMSESNQLSLFD